MDNGSDSPMADFISTHVDPPDLTAELTTIERLFRVELELFGLDAYFDRVILPLVRTRAFHFALVAVVSTICIRHVVWPQVCKYRRRRQIRASIDAARRYRQEKLERLDRQVLDFINNATDEEKRQFEEAEESVRTSALETLQRLRDGDLKPLQVLRAYQKNCLTAQQYGNPLTDVFLKAEQEMNHIDVSDKADKPLWGLVFSAKECFAVRGTESTCGFADHLGKYSNRSNDAAVVDALRQCGAVLVGKSNVPQSLWSFACSNPIHGFTANPFMQNRSPGGSSGGEGCLVAMNGSALGVGTDGGGSVRIPGHFSGVCAIKPTTSRLGQDVVEAYRRLPLTTTSIGFLSKEVELLALALKCVIATGVIHERDPYASSIAFRDDVYRSEARLRIGWYESDECFPALPPCRRAVRLAKEQLEEAGHELVAFQPPDMERAHRIFTRGLKPVIHELITEKMLVEPADQSVRTMPTFFIWLLGTYLNPLVRLFSKRYAGFVKTFASTTTAEDLSDVLRDKQEYSRLFMQQWRERKLDLLLAPVFPVPAPPHDMARDLTSAASYTALYNLLDLPAGVVPMTRVTESDEQLAKAYDTQGDLMLRLARLATLGSTGMPIGVQIVGRPLDEERVLRAMRLLQKSSLSIEQSESGSV